MWKSSSNRGQNSRIVKIKNCPSPTTNQWANLNIVKKLYWQMFDSFSKKQNIDKINEKPFLHKKDNSSKWIKDKFNIRFDIHGWNKIFIKSLKTRTKINEPAFGIWRGLQYITILSASIKNVSNNKITNLVAMVVKNNRRALQDKIEIKPSNRLWKVHKNNK